MTKTIFLFAALSTISISALAIPKPMDPVRVRQYQIAVTAAIAKNDLRCVYVAKPNADSFLASQITFIPSSSSYDTQSGWVDLTGTQPSIALMYTTSKGVRNMVTMSTSPDSKRVVSIVGQQLTLETVNLGTILEPNISKDYVAKSSENFNCLPVRP